MSDSILQSASDFFTSDSWWSQILDFMLSKCEPFKAAPAYSLEEYQIYQEYMDFIQKLVDEEMCKQLNISPQQFEDAMLQGLENNNHIAISLKDTIEHAVNFTSFCNDMIAHNERIEKEVESVMKKEYALVLEQEESNENQDQQEPQNNAFQIHEPSAMKSSNVPRSNITPPLKPQNSQQQQQVQPPQTNNINMPSYDNKTPRNPRCIQNRLSMALPAAIAQRLRKGGIQPPTSGLPGILSRKKETLQTMQSGMPSLKIPKTGPAKLPPLGKSPRF